MVEWPVQLVRFSVLISFYPMNPNEFRKIECLKCGWSTFLDTEGVFQWLVKHGVFGPNHDLEDEILYELFYGNAAKYRCPDCYAAELEISTVIDDFSDVEPRRCRGCADVIPPGRRGENLDLNVEYCPVCGSVMELVRVGNSFEWCCTRVPSCRFLQR